MNMDHSVRGRKIEYLDGDPAAVISRGNAIESLGEAMGSSADLLKAIKDEASEQQGKAIDKLRETIGDSHETLKKAAGLYTPVGPVLVAYGEELEYHQPEIKTRVDNCEELRWKVPAVAEPDEFGEDDEETKEARQAWEEEAVLFDAAYDEWEDAFEKAVNDITDEMADTIEDGGWRTFLSDLGKILEVVGLVVGILAIVIGGPVLFWIALVVGLAALAVTLCQASYGDKDGGDIALAALGGLPFGKAGTGLAKGAHLFSGTLKNATGSGSFAAAKVVDAPASNRLMEMTKRAFSGKDTGDFTNDVLALRASKWRTDKGSAWANEIGGYGEAFGKFLTGFVSVSNWTS